MLPGDSLSLLAEALYCVCLNVLIVTLYSAHLLYCTSLSGSFTHPSSLCLLFLRLRDSDGKVVGRGQRHWNKSTTVGMIDRKVPQHRRNNLQGQGVDSTHTDTQRGCVKLSGSASCGNDHL